MQVEIKTKNKTLHVAEKCVGHEINKTIMNEKQIQNKTKDKKKQLS